MGNPQHDDLKTKLHDALDEMILAQKQQAEARAHVQSLALALRDQAATGENRPATPPDGSGSALSSAPSLGGIAILRDAPLSTAERCCVAVAKSDLAYSSYELARAEFWILMGEFDLAVADYEFDMVHRFYSNCLDSMASPAIEANGDTTSMESDS